MKFRKRTNAILTLGVGLAAIVAVCLALRKPMIEPAPIDPIDSMLAVTCPDVHDQALVTMDEAVSRLSKSTGIPIVLDWPQLQKAGVVRARTLSQFGGGNLLSALRNLAEFYSDPPLRQGFGPTFPLRFSIIEDGTLFVSVDHDARELRIYDVRDLLTDEYWGLQPYPWQSQATSTSRADALRNEIALRSGANEETSAAYIISPVDRIDAVAGEFCIITTPAVHKRIERILASLRQLKTGGTH